MTSSSSSSPEISAATSTDSQDRFSYKHASHDEVLEDLSSRFILNLPDEELASLERICFQVEQAHWFYEDFIREENPKFPSLPLKKFSAMLFHACPLLHQWSHDHEQAFNTFMQYKTRVPVCGAIMLDDTWEKCVLVKGWKTSSGWGFPKGKINEDEPEPSCAIREVLEETGYNLAGQIDPEDVIEMSIKEQKISLYIVPGVPEDYPFKTKTRKEISKIEWFKLTDLPTWKRNKAAPGKFYLISPFIGALKAFINERKPRGIPFKTVKAKKLVTAQTSHLRKEPTPYTAFHDTTQESSSQSSSVDNGDPQTPSPQYTESIANRVAHVVECTPSTEAIDPHFARLLSSLTMSASTSLTNDNSDKRAPLSLSVKPNSTISNTPIPISPTAIPDWSASAPTRLSDRPGVSPLPQSVISPASIDIGCASPHCETSQSQIRRPPSSHSLHPHVSAIHNEPSQSQSPPFCSGNITSSPSCSVMSPGAIPTRRMSSTADISPYLSRPVEVPTSAKRLKQLALLESVADESARMRTSPFLVHRDYAHQAAIHNVDTGSRYSIPSASVASPSMMPHVRKDEGILYSSATPALHAMANGPAFPTFSGPQGLTSAYDPFQVRSKTSHGLHRPVQLPSGNLSMNQSQLLALMNDPRPPTRQMPYLYQQQSSIQSPDHPAFYMPTPPHMHQPANTPGLPLHAGYSPNYHSTSIISRNSPAPPPFTTPLSTGFNLSFKTNAHPSANPLLSILNGNKTASRI